MSATVKVRAGLVHHLRHGLRIEFGSASESLAVITLMLESDPSIDRMSRSLAIFDAARALLDRIGWPSDDLQGDIDLDFEHDHSFVVFKALYGQLQSEIFRLEETALRGVEPDLGSREEVQELWDLVAIVRKQVKLSGQANALEWPVGPAASTQGHRGRWLVSKRGRQPRR